MLYEGDESMGDAGRGAGIAQTKNMQKCMNDVPMWTQQCLVNIQVMMKCHPRIDRKIKKVSAEHWLRKASGKMIWCLQASEWLITLCFYL